MDKKTRFGDGESDLISDPKGKGYIATFVERSTGVLLAAQCVSRDTAHYNMAAFNTLGKLPKHAVHTVTVDRGTAFFGYREREQKPGVSYSFCHPRCPNERGLNEQVNGLLRQFFPKHKPLLDRDEALTRAVALVNHRPRKRLDYKTPVEMLTALGLDVVLTF